MPRALLDTSVLFAATYRRDNAHDTALPILRGVDDGSLPEAVILDYVLAETMNASPPTPDTMRPSIFLTESKRMPASMSSR